MIDKNQRKNDRIPSLCCFLQGKKRLTLHPHIMMFLHRVEHGKENTSGPVAKRRIEHRTGPLK